MYISSIYQTGISHPLTSSSKHQLFKEAHSSVGFSTVTTKLELMIEALTGDDINQCSHREHY